MDVLRESMDAPFEGSVADLVRRFGQDRQPRLMVTSELDDFECNPNQDWFAGQGCYEPERLLTTMSWWRYLPLVNICVEMLNDLPIMPDRLEQLLSMLATVSALQLASATAVPLAFTHNELEAAIVRLAPNGTYHDPTKSVAWTTTHAGPNFVEVMGLRLSSAITYQMMCLLVTFSIYMCLAVTSFRDPWTGDTSSVSLRVSVWSDP